MEKEKTVHLLNQASDFEQATRNLRWVCIAAVVITFPTIYPQVLTIYWLAVLAVLYSATRYSSVLMRVRWYASPITVLAFDGIFISMLLLLTGNIATPYSAFLLFLIISASYKYGLRGALVASGLLTVWLYIIIRFPISTPVVFSRPGLFIISGFDLLALGLLVERLSRNDRVRRGELEQLSSEKDAERSRLLALVNSIQDAVLLVDDKGVITQCNEMATSIIGKGELAGKSISHVMPLHLRSDPTGRVVNLLVKNMSVQRRRDLQYSTDKGNAYDLEIQVTPIQFDAGQAVNYIIVCRDITKEHSLDEQRLEFISVASHELRTPVAIMEAALSAALLDRSNLSEQTLKLLVQAHRNTVYLADIVKDLAMLAEAQNDTLPVELTKIDANEVLAQIERDFSAQARQSGLKLITHVAKDTPSVLSTEHHIYEILQNYIINALKYTSHGSVTISAEAGTDDSLLFSVQDTGIGISPTDQKRLFTKFFRAEDYRTRKTGGTGLGLYLCQELAQRLNARLWCRSELNKGSSFYLEVPPFSRLKRDRGEIVQAQVSTLIDEL